ncbi:MAG: transcriptional regulator [Paenibacillus sp. RIFOXYA1_FULL_44_5]|nr:MAG: transcriptional regulator [Paenibacillus sp. RIFOXYA1_FULL_44_5]
MDTIESMAERYKLLSDKSRLTILGLLKEKELCVCDIVEIMKMSQPNVSQHMRKLKTGGLVKETKSGHWVHYSLSPDCPPYILSALEHIPAMKVDSFTQTNQCKI